MEYLLASLEVSDHSSCVVPCCEEPRASARLHRGARTCVRHLVQSLEADKSVLLDKLKSSDARLRSAEQVNVEMRVKLRDFSRVVERDVFVAALVHEREAAVQAWERVKEQMRELEARIGRVIL